MGGIGSPLSSGDGVMGFEGGGLDGMGWDEGGRALSWLSWSGVRLASGVKGVGIGR